MKHFLILLFYFSLPLFVFSQDLKTQTVRPRKVQGTKSTGTLPALIRGPYLQVATTNSIVIRWRTDALSRSRVRYGATAGNLDQKVDDAKLKTEHIIKLSGLTPNTKYYYSIGSLQDTLQRGNNNFFVTLPPAGQEGKYRIGIFGDCGQNSVLHRTVRDQFIKYLGNNTLNSWMLLGDNAYPDGEDAQYQTNFFNIHKDELLKKYPLFPVPGNHDYHDMEFTQMVAQKTHEISYYSNFSMPINGESGGVPSNNQSYYSYDVGNIHFLALDSYGMEDNQHRLSDTIGAQVQWIKKDLAANKNKGWVVAYWHHPPYTMGSHNSDTETELVKIRENFIQILERAGVDLVICGHSHNYERSRLMMGHYGMEPTFNAAKYNLSQSSGMYNGTKNSAPYVKDDKNDKGIVYVMTGSVASVGIMKPTFPHDAMPFANSAIGGSAILEVEGNRLDFKWICADGVIRDQFTMMKNVNQKTKIKARKGEPVTLQASFVGNNYKWSNSNEKTRSIQFTPTATGTKTYTVTDEYNNIKDTFEVKVGR